MTTAIDTIVLNADAANLATPDVTKLTTQSLQGTGVFDILMASTKLHLQEEYEEGRITGQEYSTVYLGALTAILQQSVQFLLNHQQEEKIIAEISLLRQKVVTELAQTDDTLPSGLGFNGTEAVQGIVASEVAINDKKADLIDSDITKSEAEIALYGQKVVTELAQTCDNLNLASADGHGYNDSALLEGLLKAKQEQTEAEVDLITQKVTTEVAQTSDTKPADLGMMTTTAIDGLVQSQKDKTEAEVILLSQKSATELAQTSDTIPAGTALNPGTSTDGMIGKQKDLVNAQTDGFARDAEQKITKMMLDTWSVSATAGEGTANTTNKLDDASLGAVVTKAKAGIGVGA